MPSSDTCSTIRDDVCIAYGEDHTFIIQFTTDRDISSAQCTLTVKRNNSDDDADAVFRQQVNVLNKLATITLSNADSRSIGEGVYWYDIWLKDGPDYEKPLVYGTLTVPYMTTRSQ